MNTPTNNSTLRYFEDDVEWRHHRVGRAHTLLRVAHSAVTGRAVAVVSEPAINPGTSAPTTSGPITGSSSTPGSYRRRTAA